MSEALTMDAIGMALLAGAALCFVVGLPLAMRDLKHHHPEG